VNNTGREYRVVRSKPYAKAIAGGSVQRKIKKKTLDFNPQRL